MFGSGGCFTTRWDLQAIPYREPRSRRAADHEEKPFGGPGRASPQRESLGADLRIYLSCAVECRAERRCDVSQRRIVSPH
jgi:hypothetical protein